MYRIINITDKAGNIKEDFIAELKAVHPEMKGQLLYPINQELVGMGLRLCFVWADKSEKMLRTSLIEDFSEKGNFMIITTLNSIYTLERMK